MTTPSSGERRTIDADIAVLGAGAASIAMIKALRGDPSIVVFEPGLVGGECPYDACIPSKAMLHDGALGRSWSTASARRRDLVSHRDDTAHADDLLASGQVTLVRESGRFLDPGRVVSESVVVNATHVVIATGSRPVVPELDGLGDVRDLVWTADEALRAAERPDRLVIAGGGVIGCEFATLFRSFGTDVVVLEPAPGLFANLHADVSSAIESAMHGTGATLRLGCRPTSVRRFGDRIAVIDDHGAEYRADRLLLAIGRRPNLADAGLDSLGVPADVPLPIDDTGRVRCGGSVWAIGDVAGREQYTHAAVHHGRVVADHLTGDRRRRLDDVVAAACMFIDPPVLTVGPPYADTVDDPDVVWTSVDLSVAARSNTDERAGVLALAASRRSRRLVAAHGIGAGFDELIHAVVVAVDAAVTVDRMVESMVPFPTMGDVLHAGLHRLIADLGH